MSKHHFSTGLAETSSRKVFHDGCAKRDIFSQQILNKNRLCLAHCALNRSFTVSIFVSCNFSKKFKNSKWLLYLARQKYFENWHGYSAEISSRSKILLNSLHLARFSRYKYFCVLQKLRKFKIATIFGETKPEH